MNKSSRLLNITGRRFALQPTWDLLRILPVQTGKWFLSQVANAIAAGLFDLPILADHPNRIYPPQ